MPDPPTYLDGEPANLPAAAKDALDWLKFLTTRPLTQKNRRRLKLAIKALEAYLPDEPPVFDKSPDAQAVLAVSPWVKNEGDRGDE